MQAPPLPASVIPFSIRCPAPPFLRGLFLSSSPPLLLLDRERINHLKEESVSYFLLTLMTYSGTSSLPLALHSLSIQSYPLLLKRLWCSGALCYGAKQRAMRGRF